MIKITVFVNLRLNSGHTSSHTRYCLIVRSALANGASHGFVLASSVNHSCGSRAVSDGFSLYTNMGRGGGDGAWLLLFMQERSGVDNVSLKVRAASLSSLSRGFNVQSVQARTSSWRFTNLKRRSTEFLSALLLLQ